MNKQEKSPVLGWLLSFLILPLIFAIIFTGIILYLIGYDFKSSAQRVAQKVPVLGEFVQVTAVESTDKTKDLDAELKEKQESIIELQGLLFQKENQARELKNTNETLIQELKTAQEALQNKNQTEEQRLAELKSLVRIYETMSTKEAAKIIGQLKLEEAALILNQMKSDAKAEIMAKLDPAFSAEITNYFLESIDYKTLQLPIQLLVDIFDTIPEQDAAALLQELGDSEDFPIGLEIIRKSDPDKLGAFLENMEKEIASKYLEALNN